MTQPHQLTAAAEHGSKLVHDAAHHPGEGMLRLLGDPHHDVVAAVALLTFRFEHVPAVRSRTKPNRWNTQANWLIKAAPMKMNPVRAIRANTIPNSSAFCWSARGTTKLVMMMRKTNKLSTDNAFSVT